MKIRMFSQRILEFVKSIDIVDKEIFFDLMNVIETYVRDHLDVAYFAVLEEGPVDEQVGLRTLYSTREEKPSYTVDKAGDYASHSAFTFGENRPIWIVSARDRR